MAIKKFKIEASEQAKQLAKKPVKASDGEWDKAVVSFIDSIPTLPEQGKVISKKYKGFPVVIVGLGDGKCLYNGYTRTNDAASDVQFIRGLIKRGDSPEKATANFGFKTYTRGEVEGACGGKKKSVKSAAGKKRWGLYSDFGQKILNETFDSKREAQKAFREYGYTKDSEAWIEEVDETAVGKFDKKPANSACGGKKSVKSAKDKSNRVSPEIQGRIDSLNRLKKVLNEYSENEFGHEMDFSNLKEVHLAYTTDEYNEDELQVTADLENFKITYSRYDEDGLNNEYVERYKSWDEMADVLDGVTFDLLIADVPEHDDIYGACGGKKTVKSSTEYLEAELADKTKYKLLKDAYDRNNLTIVKHGNSFYFEHTPSKKVADLAIKEVKRLYPELTYIGDIKSSVRKSVNAGRDNLNYRPKKKSIKPSKRSRSVKAASADGYDFAFYRDGYRVLTKTENNRGKWLAQKDNEEPFEITYEQARGFEPIDPRNKALQLKVGKALKFPIKSAAEDSSSELNQVYKALGEMQGTWKNPETGWTGKCEIYQRDLEDGSYVFSLVFGNNTSEPDDILYVPSKHKFTIYPNSGMPRFANSLDEFKRNLKAEYSYLTKVGDNVKSSIRRPVKKTGIKAAKKDNMNKEAHKWYNISLTKDEYAKFRKFLKENGYKYEPSEEGQNTYVKVYLTKADADKINKFLDSMDDVESACGGKKSKKTVKASAAAKRRAKQRVAASVDTEDIVMYWDGQKVYEGPVDSDMTRKVKWFLDEPEKLQQVVDYCNSFGDPVIEDTSDTMDVAATFVEMVDYELREADSIDDDVYISDEKGNFEIFRKSDEVTGAKKSVKCAVNSSRYYQITDHNNDEVGRSDIEDEARELAKKLLRENDEDNYDIWWVDTDPDSTDETTYIDTIYADKPFSVEGYYDDKFRDLSDSGTFYELKDALEYAQELLGKGTPISMECENAGGRVEITPDEYEEFMMTEPEYFEDLPKLAEWLSDVRAERMDSNQEPWLDNWQYNTDIGMSVNGKSIKCDAYAADGESLWDYIVDYPNVKEMGPFNSDTADFDVNSAVANYITSNYGIYAESVSYVEYNGPEDWSVDMFQNGEAVTNDFMFFFEDRKYELFKDVFGEFDDEYHDEYYDYNAIHGNDFQFQFYPAQNQWTAPQIDIDEAELMRQGFSQESIDKIKSVIPEFEAEYINICQEINYNIESYLKELSEEYVEASANVKAAIGNKNKTDYGSNPIYELDKYVKDLAEGVAAAAGITLTYQVSDEAITFIDGDGTAVFIQPISEITPEPDDLENDIQELVSAIQYSDMDNSEYWPEDTAENDPDYATRAVQMSVDDDLEPVMGEGEDVGFGIDSNGETIDESTVSELYRIAEKEILPNTELAQLDPYVSIDEDSWDFYFGGISNNGMMGVVKFYFHFKLTSDNIDLNEYVLPDAKLYPDFNYYKASLDFDIYTENGKVTDVVLESADIYKSDNSYDSHFSGKFGEAFNTEALENYIEKLAAPAAEEIYNAVSNL